MSLFLIRFWPVLIPLVVYWLWLRLVGRRAMRAGKPRPMFRDGPWYWAVLASLVTGLICFLFLGVSLSHNKGTYVPAHMENGAVIEGGVAH